MEIKTENTACYSGQSNFTATASEAGQYLGHLDYVIFEEKPSMAFIEVDVASRRQGIGRLLLQHLQAKFPDQEIDFGMRTDDGHELLSASTRIEPVPAVIALKAKQIEVQKELDELNRKSDAFQALLNPSPEQCQEHRNWFAGIGEDWNKLHDTAYELEMLLDRGAGMSDTRIMVILDGPAVEVAKEAAQKYQRER